MKKVLFIIPYYNHPSNVASFRNSYWINQLEDDCRFDLKIYTLYSNTEENISIYSRTKLIFSIIKSDIIIISGPPFEYFTLTPLIRLLNLKGKIILDYRDPFSYNPRFKESWLRKTLKRVIEYIINCFADNILTITEEARDIIASRKNKISVIANGYGDLCSYEGKKDLYHLIYTGRMYEHTDLSPLLNSISFQLTYIGSSVVKDTRINHLGKVSYQESIKMIQQSRICLIYSNNSTYQTYTKLYDYIGCKKPILLIWEDDQVTHKSFLDIIENYPFIKMAYNNEKSIKEALCELNNLEDIEIDTSQYSRKASYEKFLRILDE